VIAIQDIRYNECVANLPVKRFSRADRNRHG
jgi:hypothetical protein